MSRKALAIVPAGADLALHHHQGTQVAYVEKGTLTYTVEKGASGEWLVEQPTDHHSAANRTDKKIEIYLSTLLKTGAPPSTPG